MTAHHQDVFGSLFAAALTKAADEAGYSRVVRTRASPYAHGTTNYVAYANDGSIVAACGADYPFLGSSGSALQTLVARVYIDALFASRGLS